MEVKKVKEMFAFGADSYFGDLLDEVDRINPSSKSRAQIKQLYTSIGAAMLHSTPTEVTRGVTGPLKQLVDSGTDLYYRLCQLAPQGPKDLVAILAMDVSRLPQSCHESITAALADASEPLTPVRLLTFVLTKGNRVGFQPTMLLATRNPVGSLVPIAHSFQWSVSGHVLGGMTLTGPTAEEETDRLTFLLNLVMQADAATLHAASPSTTDHTRRH